MSIRKSDEPLLLLGEEWRDVVGSSEYQVSNLGRIKSKARTVVRFNPRWQCASPLSVDARILRQGKYYGTNRDGSRRARPAATTVEVSIDGKRCSRYVHHLVLEAFVGLRPQGTEACHRDGDGTNNKLWNLRWDTHMENVKDSIVHGTFWPKLRGRKTA